MSACCEELLHPIRQMNRQLAVLGHNSSKKQLKNSQHFTKVQLRSGQSPETRWGFGPLVLHVLVEVGTCVGNQLKKEDQTNETEKARLLKLHLTTG